MDLPIDFDRQHEPVVFREAAREWPAWSRWNMAWLSARCGSHLSPVHTGRYRRGPAARRAQRDGSTVRMSVGAWVEAVQRGEAPGYLAGCELLHAVPALGKDLLFPARSRSPLSVDVLWLGISGQVTPLHFDRALNLNAQLRGRKRFFFFAPTRALSPLRVTWTHSHSALDLGPPLPFDALGLRPDLELYLGPGDVLFIPYGWWHRVETIEDSIAVNRWWWSAGTVRRRMGDALAAMAGIRLGPPTDRRYRSERGLRGPRGCRGRR